MQSLTPARIVDDKWQPALSQGLRGPCHLVRLEGHTIVTSRSSLPAQAINGLPPRAVHTQQHFVQHSATHKVQKGMAS